MSKTTTTSLTVRLPRDLDRWLANESRACGQTKGKIVRDQLERLRTETLRQPFLDLAGCVEGSPDLSRAKGFSK